MAISDSEIAAALAGRFIAVDGVDGSGKTTQFRRLGQRLVSAGMSVCPVREPGGTPVGEAIRRILLNDQETPLTPMCEMLLFMASRAQLMTTTILPALAAGQVVLADRFTSSTMAYQVGRGDVTQSDVLLVAGIVQRTEPSKVRWPDVTVIYDIPQEEYHARRPVVAGRDRVESRMDAEWQKTRENYLEQVRQWPERYMVADGRLSPDELANDVLTRLVTRLQPAA